MTHNRHHKVFKGAVLTFLRVKSLSLHGCYNIDCELVKKMNEEQWHIGDLTLSSTPSSPQEGVEIDPDYK